jgi:hypothetical protein
MEIRTMTQNPVYGKCTSKNFRITPDWKCVDFRINDELYPAIEQKRAVIEKCRAKNYFDVCPDCRYFKKV